MNKLKLKLGISLLVFLLAACGDQDEGVGVAPKVVDTEREEPEAMPDPEPEGYGMLLEAIDELPLSGPSTTTMPVRVQLLDIDTREPIGEEPVNFELLQASADTSLTTTSSVTAPNGGATVEVRLGAEGTGLIEVTHPDAAPLLVDFNIGAEPLGNIQVNIVEPTNVPVMLEPFQLSFFPTEDFACDAFIPNTQLPATYKDTQTADASQPVLVEGFEGEANYTVVVQALGAGGRHLASGCTDGVGVTANTTTSTTVYLDLHPIWPTGKYTVDAQWDIADAMAAASDATSSLVGIIDFMADPGASIYNLIITEIDNAVDFPLSAILDITGVEQQIITYINEQLFQIEGVDTFVAISNDLSNMLHNMQVTALLDIRKTDEDLQFSGNEKWTNITVNWTWRCQNSADPNCGVETLDLTGPDAAAAQVEYDWLGHVEGYDGFVVNSHEAQLDVGQLQLYLLEKVIIPEITGGAADSIEGAIQHWVNCADLAQQAIAGNDICDPTGTLCLGQTIIEGACTAAVSEVASQILDPIDESVILDIEMAGQARLIDITSNGSADEIVDGVNTGIVTGSGEAIGATWTAVRIDEMNPTN